MPYQARWRGNQADLRTASRRASTNRARPRCGAASQKRDYEHARLARRQPWRTRPRRNRFHRRSRFRRGSRFRLSSLVLRGDAVERGAERAASRAIAIAHKRMADDLERHAVLQGDAGHDRAVTRGSVGVATALAVGEEHLFERAVGESADGRDIAQATDFKIESFG